MRKEGANLGDPGQIVSHDGQRCLQRLLRQLAVLLEGVPAPPLGHVLEGEQRLPLRVIPASPQYPRGSGRTRTRAELPSPKSGAGCSTASVSSASTTSRAQEVSPEEIG